MFKYIALCALLQVALAVKVKVVMHSAEADESRADEDDARSETWPNQKKEITSMPFLKSRPKTRLEEKEYERDDKLEEKVTEKPAPRMHPNEMIFPLIYQQSHINSMFKLGDNWYTWSTEKRTDGSKATNYYICYDEPKHCDDVGWERTDALPKCAFQIDSLLPEDRACINNFGIEPHNSAAGLCDGAEQMKVSDMVRACGPRIRSLWRFFRVGRRPSNAQKPADVNSLVCEDEEECFITIEYRIHHDRITFSLHEPTRGQTFKSVLKRDVEEEKTTTEPPVMLRRKTKKKQEEDQPVKTKKYRTRVRSKVVEGKGVSKDDNEVYRKSLKNKIKLREDASDDLSE